MVPPEKRTSSFSPVSVSGVLVGLSSLYKAYRYFIPSLNDIVFSNNVKFNDKLFPYKKSTDLPISNMLPPSDVNFGAKTGGAVLPMVVDISVVDTDSSYVPSDDPNTTSKSTRWNTSELRSSPLLETVASEESIVSVQSTSPTVSPTTKLTTVVSDCIQC